MISVEDKIQFRLSQSKEKLALAKIFLEKEKKCDSILSSYRAIFYAIRVFLADKNKDIDSDDPDTILHIFEQYCRNNLLMNNVLQLVAYSKQIKERAENSHETITDEDARIILQNAISILEQVEQHISAH